MGRRRKKIGRPTKLEAGLVGQMLLLIRDGVPPPVAAGAAGIGVTTYYDWMRRGLEKIGRKGGRKGDSTYQDFRRSVTNAKHGCHAELARKVYEAGKVDGKLGLAILSKRFASYWADRDSLELRGSEEAPLRVSVEIIRTVREPAGGIAEGSAHAEQK